MISRARVYEVLELADPEARLGKFVDFFLIILISVNVIAVIIETVDWVYADYAFWFDALELVSNYGASALNSARTTSM